MSDETRKEETEELISADDGAIEVPGAPAEAAEAEEDRIAQLEAEKAELKDQALRALAEAENTRRRAQRDREDAAKYGITAFARDILPVADNLRRALEAIPEEARSQDSQLQALYDGVSMTERELLAAMEKHKITPINALGQKFDHNYHQAMFELEDPSQPPGTVVQVLQTGYVLHDRLLRPAMVGVAKGGAPEAPAEPGDKVDTSA